MTDQEIIELLIDRLKQNPPEITLLAKVKSVDEEEMTCVLVDGDVEIPEVRLRPVLDGKQSLTIFPKPGTWCLAVRLEDGDEWMLMAVGEVEKYRINQGNLVFEIEDGKLSVKNDTTDLLTVIKDICEACLQIVVIQGNNPDYVKLNNALTNVQTLLK